MRSLYKKIVEAGGDPHLHGGDILDPKPLETIQCDVWLQCAVKSLFPVDGASSPAIVEDVATELILSRLAATCLEQIFISPQEA